MIWVFHVLCVKAQDVVFRGGAKCGDDEDGKMRDLTGSENLSSEFERQSGVLGELDGLRGVEVEPEQLHRVDGEGGEAGVDLDDAPEPARLAADSGDGHDEDGDRVHRRDGVDVEGRRDDEGQDRDGHGEGLDEIDEVPGPCDERSEERAGERLLCRVDVGGADLHPRAGLHREHHDGGEGQQQRHEGARLDVLRDADELEREALGEAVLEARLPLVGPHLEEVDEGDEQDEEDGDEGPERAHEARGARRARVHDAGGEAQEREEEGEADGVGLVGAEIDGKKDEIRNAETASACSFDDGNVTDPTPILFIAIIVVVDTTTVVILFAIIIIIIIIRFGSCDVFKFPMTGKIHFCIFCD